MYVDKQHDIRQEYPVTSKAIVGIRSVLFVDGCFLIDAPVRRPWCRTKTMPTWLWLGAAILFVISTQGQVSAAPHDAELVHNDGSPQRVASSTNELESDHRRYRRSPSRVSVASVGSSRLISMFVVRRCARAMIMARWLTENVQQSSTRRPTKGKTLAATEMDIRDCTQRNNRRTLISKSVVLACATRVSRMSGSRSSEHL